MSADTISRPELLAGDPADDNGRRTAGVRLAVSASALVALVLWIGGLAGDEPLGRGTGALVYLLWGVGSAPWQFNRSLRLHARVALAGATGLSVLLLGSTAMISLEHWAPMAATAVLVAVTSILHVFALFTAAREIRHSTEAAGSRTRPLPVLQLGVLALGMALCLTSALRHRHLTPEFWGFPLQLGVSWLLGLGLVLASALAFPFRREAVTATAVTGLMLVLTLTSSIVYDGPRTLSVAKHVDMVDQIITLGHPNSAVEVYNSWSGFFAANAWLSGIVDIDDPMQLALFWPPLLGLLRVAALRYLMGKLTDRPRIAWLGVTFAVLADSQGVDYFSPQSVGFVLGLVVFALALSTSRSVVRTMAVLGIGSALAVSHQLSPYIVGGVLLVLAAFGAIRQWWLPALVLGPAVAWTAAHFSAVAGFLHLGQIGKVANLRPPVTTASAGLERLPVVGASVLALLLPVVLIGMLALVTLVRQSDRRLVVRALRRRWSSKERLLWGCAAAPGVGLALVLVNPYGNEGLFRAVLFATPWLAALACLAFEPRTWEPGVGGRHRPTEVRPSGGGPLPRLATSGLGVLLTLCFLVSAFGMDAVKIVRNGDLAALHHFAQQGAGDSSDPQIMLLLGAGDLPTVPSPTYTSHDTADREDIYVPIRQLDPFDGPAAVQELTAALVVYSTEPAGTVDLFAMWSPTSAAYGEAYGVQTLEQFTALRDAFTDSPYWKVDFAEDGTVVLRFDVSGWVAP